MEKITPEAEALGLDELYESVQAQLKDLRAELAIYIEEMQAGGDVQHNKVKDALTRVRGLVQQCTGLEKTLAESRQRLSGGSSGVELDFERVRSEVRCALNRIRAGRGSGAISE